MAEAIRCETTSPELPVRYGELVRVEAVFTDLITGAAIDPTQIDFLAKKPDDEEITLVYLTDAALKRKVAGVYYVDLEVDDVGVWRYRFQSEEEKIGVAEGQITVRPSGVL